MEAAVAFMITALSLCFLALAVGIVFLIYDEHKRARWPR